MRDTVYRHLVEQCQNSARINTCGFEKCVTEGATLPRGLQSLRQAFDDTARQRIAIGVQARCGQAQYPVAGVNCLAINQRVALDNADTKTGQVEVTVGVKARHFG